MINLSKENLKNVDWLAIAKAFQPQQLISAHLALKVRLPVRRVNYYLDKQVGAGVMSKEAYLGNCTIYIIL